MQAATSSRMTSGRRLLAAAPASARAGACALLLASGAFGEPADDASSGEIEEIVVTISKRAEPLHELPAAVSAFDARAIEAANLQSFEDLATLVPNVTIKGGANDALSIRGISQSFTSQSPVALHVNGVFKVDNTALQTALYDLAAVELARGPAGIVYGRNATAGALNIRWAEPTAAFVAKGEVTGGNLGAYDVRGAVNVPFLGAGDERLTGRFVLQRTVSDTALDDLETERGDGSLSIYSARGTLRSVASERTTLVAHGHYTKRHGFPIYGKPLLGEFPIGQLTTQPFGIVRADPYQGMQLFLTDVTNAVLTPTTPEAQQLRALARIQACGPFGPCPLPVLTASVQSIVSTIFNLDPSLQGVVAQPTPASGKRVRSRILERAHPKGEVFGGDVQLEHALPELPGVGPVTLSALLGWDSESIVQLVDVDGSELPVLDDVQANQRETWTGEVRLASDGDGAFDFILGVFAFDAEFDGRQSTLTPFGEIRSRQQRAERGYAPFGQATLRPLELGGRTPELALELFGGVRFNVDHYDRDQTNFDTPAGCTPPFCVRELRSLASRKKFTETTWESGVRWLVSDAHMLYAKWAHGYKAGLTELVAQDGTVNDVEPEQIDAAEIGWKGAWRDDRVQTALTAFHYDYSDLQVPQLIQGQVLTRNAAAATIWGLEAELRWRPTPATEIALTASHLDATFDTFCADDVLQPTPVDDAGCMRDATAPPLDGTNGLLNLAGNRLEDSPEWKASAFARQSIPLGAYGFLTAIAEISWSARYYRRPFNEFPDGVSDYHRTDLRLVWSDASEAWRVEAFVQNLEDESIYGRVISGPEFTAGNPVGISSYAPRTYGLRVGFRWGE
jgi:outer membrane receptor protein involved in Fe transport